MPKKSKKKPPPEGPEAKIISTWLNKWLFPDGSLCNVLQKVEPISGRYAKVANWLQGHGDLLPLTLRGVNTKGKCIYLTGDRRSLVFTLGMTGNFSLEPTKYARVKFTFSGTPPVYFTDIRNFGTVRFLTAKDLEAKLKSLGLDPLNGRIESEQIILALGANSELTLAEFLMDQQIIAGIGNYLKAEILWHAKLSPHRLAKSLNRTEANDLTAAINIVPSLSLESGGATIRNYSSPDGNRGAFADMFNVYGRKTDSLDADGNSVLKDKTKDNRSTSWSPKRQL